MSVLEDFAGLDAKLDRIAPLLGARLRELRYASGKGLPELSRRSRIKYPNLLRIERGEHVPRLASLVKYAHALEAPIGEVLRCLDALDEVGQ